MGPYCGGMHPFACVMWVRLCARSTVEVKSMDEVVAHGGPVLSIQNGTFAWELEKVSGRMYSPPRSQQLSSPSVPWSPPGVGEKTARRYLPLLQRKIQGPAPRGRVI